MVLPREPLQLCFTNLKQFIQMFYFSIRYADKRFEKTQKGVKIYFSITKSYIKILELWHQGCFVIIDREYGLIIKHFA